MQNYISREQDYALRITSALAALKEKKQLSVTALSQQLEISRIFAARIVHKLSVSGIVTTTQGRHGGVSLKKPANKLSIYHVLKTIGFKTTFNSCTDDSFHCGFSNKCQFHAFFAREENEFHERMKNKMISEFISK